jgi:hypothetical protein
MCASSHARIGDDFPVKMGMAKNLEQIERGA